MKALAIFVITILLFTNYCVAQVNAGTDKDRKALEQTSIAIRSAFTNGDVLTIILYHHHDVKKALGYTHIINGRDELEKDLKNTFSHVKLKWLENNVESLIFQDNTAIEMTVYTIEITATDGSKPFTSKGRAMIIYIRSSESPSGWASIRELIQPESK